MGQNQPGKSFEAFRDYLEQLHQKYQANPASPQLVDAIFEDLAGIFEKLQGAPEQNEPHKPKTAKTDLVEIAKFPEENPNPILRVSREEIILYANSASRTILEAWGSRVSQSVPTNWLERIFQVDRSSERKSFDGKIGEKWFSFNLVPISGADYINLYGEDITERKRIEQEREQLLAKIQRQSALLDAIFEADPAGVAVLVGNDLRFAFINCAYRYLTPDPVKDPIGKPYDQIWPTRSQYGHRDKYQVVLLTGQPFLTTRVIHSFPDGSDRSFTVQARRIEWQDQPACLVTMWDTTEADEARQQLLSELQQRQQVELALRESEVRLTNALESTHDSVLVLDRNWRITFVNQRYATLVNRNIDELMGKIFWDILSRYLGTPVEQHYRQAMKERTPVFFETGGYYTQIWYEVSIYPTLEGISVFCSDRTEEKLTYQALRESEEKFRISLASIGDAVITTDATGLVTYLNPVAEQLTGWESREAFGRPLDQVFHIIHELTHEPAQDPVGKVLREGMIVGLANHTALMARDGRVIPVEDSAAPIKNGSGEIVGVVMVFHEVIEKRAALRALQESETSERTKAAELETLMNTIPAFVWFSRDPECRHMISNQYGYDFLNMSPGNNVSMTAPPEEFPQHHSVVRNGRIVSGEEMPMQIAARTGLAQLNQEFDVIFENGSTYHLFGNAKPLKDKDGKPSGAIGVFMDVSALKRAEQETLRLIAENEIKHRLIEQREQERLQIARDMHDGPVQELTAAALTLQGMILDCQEPNQVQSFEALKANLQAALIELRGYAQDLRPPVLSKFGLEKAIEAHLESYREKHPKVSIQFEAHQEGDLIPETMRVALFRIYQESLTNIVKHARATGVTVCLSKTVNEVTLVIQDNGLGFEIPTDWLELARHGHLGLVGIRERAEAIGGDVTIRSKPGEGTQISILVPLEPLNKES